MASAADWTVDKLLSGVATLNTKMAQAQGIIRANRTNYMNTLRSLPTIQNVATREAIRARLAAWIPKQVDTENRFNALAENYTVAKGKVKSFLQSVGVTPPGYLGAIQVAVPIIVYGAIAAGLVTVGIIIAMAVERSKGLQAIQDVAKTARENHWNAEQTTAALDAAARALASTTPDPAGIRRTLEEALPVIALIAGLVIFGPMLQRKYA